MSLQKRIGCNENKLQQVKFWKPEDKVPQWSGIFISGDGKISTNQGPEQPALIGPALSRDAGGVWTENLWRFLPT